MQYLGIHGTGTSARTDYLGISGSGTYTRTNYLGGYHQGPTDLSRWTCKHRYLGIIWRKQVPVQRLKDSKPKANLAEVTMNNEANIARHSNIMDFLWCWSRLLCLLSASYFLLQSWHLSSIKRTILHIIILHTSTYPSFQTLQSLYITTTSTFLLG